MAQVNTTDPVERSQANDGGGEEAKPTIKKSATFKSTMSKRGKDSSARRSSSGLFESITRDIMKEALHIADYYRERHPQTASDQTFPEIDYVQPYGLSQSNGDADTIWKAEANRLIDAIESPSAPLFDDPEGSKLDDDRLSALAGVALRLGWALAVYRVDFEIVMLEAKVKFFDTSNLARGHRFLERRLKNTNKMPGLHAENLAHCHAVLNLISACIARIGIKAMDELWQPKFLSALAKFTTKLKVVCASPLSSGQRSVRNSQRALETEDVKLMMGMGELDDDMDDGGWETPEIDSAKGRPGDGSEDARQRIIRSTDLALSSRHDAQSSYFAEMWVIRVALLRLFGSIFSNFQANPSLALSDDAFEITSLVFSTSYSHSRTAISQDRDAEIVASSSAAALDLTDYAMENLCTVTNELVSLSGKAGVEGPPCGITEKLEPMCYFNWEYVAVRAGSAKDEAVERDSLPVKTTREFATLLISLSCTMPVVTTTLVGLNNVCSMLTSGSSAPKPPIRYTSAVFALTTPAYEDEQLSVTEKRGVTSISKSLLSRNGALAWSPVMDAGSGSAKDMRKWKDPPPSDDVERIRERKQRLNHLDGKIDKEWEIDECSITLGCWKYSMIVAVACATLVGGGLAVGFTVGERVPGVDPFNITVFAWGFAAFILVVAKSIRVTDWPWRDFLRGRVVCRSVSEVCAVSRNVDAQDVLAWLLQNEASTVIRTRGPYNKLFVRRVEDGPAFSIDVEMDLRTMALCGIVVVEVQSRSGAALVCLNARPGVAYRAFIHSQDPEEDNWVWVCEDPPVCEDKTSVATLVPRRMGWHKVVGVYNVGQRRFR